MTGDATTRESKNVFLRWHGDGENNLIYLSIKRLVKSLFCWQSLQCILVKETMKMRGQNYYMMKSIIMYTVVPSCCCIQRSCQVDVYAFHLHNVYAAMCIYLNWMENLTLFPRLFRVRRARLEQSGKCE